MGIHGLLGFDDFIKALQRGDYADASQEMLQSVWARIVAPARAQELANLVRSSQPSTGPQS